MPQCRVSKWRKEVGEGRGEGVRGGGWKWNPRTRDGKNPRGGEKWHPEKRGEGCSVLLGCRIAWFFYTCCLPPRPAGWSVSCERCLPGCLVSSLCLTLVLFSVALTSVLNMRLLVSQGPVVTIFFSFWLEILLF